MITHDTLRPHLLAAMHDALDFVLDADDFDSTAETILDGLVERLNAQPATLPRETVTALAPATVTLPVSDPEHENRYEAAHVESATWNGWAQPWFSREVAEQIVADVNAHADGDADGSTTLDEWGTQEFDGVTLYGVGTGCWVWSRA